MNYNQLKECLHFQRYVVTLTSGTRVYIAVPHGGNVYAKAINYVAEHSEIQSIEFLEDVNLRA